MTCTICLQLFDASDADPRQWFPCSHSVHHQCAVEFSRALGAPIDSIPCPECRIVPDNAQDIVNSLGLADMHVDGGAHAGTVLEDTIDVDDETQEIPDGKGGGKGGGNDDTEEIPDGKGGGKGGGNDDTQYIPDGQPHEDADIPCPFGLDSPEFHENQVVTAERVIPVHPSAEALAVMAERAWVREGAALNHLLSMIAPVAAAEVEDSEEDKEEEADLDEESNPPSEIRAAFTAAEIIAARDAAAANPPDASDPDSDDVPLADLPATQRYHLVGSSLVPVSNEVPVCIA